MNHRHHLNRPGLVTGMMPFSDHNTVRDCSEGPSHGRDTDRAVRTADRTHLLASSSALPMDLTLPPKQPDRPRRLIAREFPLDQSGKHATSSRLPDVGYNKPSVGTIDRDISSAFLPRPGAPHGPFGCLPMKSEWFPRDRSSRCDD